jgi:hypothetical protein
MKGAGAGAAVKIFERISRRDENFGNRNPLIAGGLFSRFWAAPKAATSRHSAGKSKNRKQALI